MDTPDKPGRVTTLQSDYADTRTNARNRQDGEGRRERRADDPLGAADRHRADNRQHVMAQLSAIVDEQRRTTAYEDIERYYDIWHRALMKAYVERFDLSPRIYERKLTETRIDQRLIPVEKREEFRTQARREAVHVSRSRIDEINQVMPRWIAQTLDLALKLPAGRDRNGRPERTKPGREQARDFPERER